jgi:hypothetical protein
MTDGHLLANELTADPDLNLPLPDLEIQTPAATDSGEILGTATDQTHSAELTSPPPSQVGVISLLGTGVAMAGGSGWALLGFKKKE